MLFIFFDMTFASCSILGNRRVRISSKISSRLCLFALYWMTSSSSCFVGIGFCFMMYCGRIFCWFFHFIFLCFFGYFKVKFWCV